jgi:hypothetical protein
MDNPRPGQVHGRVFLKNGWSCSNTRTALAMYVNEFFFWPNWKREDGTPG